MNKSLREINSRRLLRYNGRIVYLCFKMAYSLGKPITKGRPAQETGHKPNERNKIKILLRSERLYAIIWASRGLLGWCMVFPVSKGLLFQEGGQIRNGFLGIQNVTGGAALLVFSGFQIQDLRLCACLLLQCVADVIALRIADNNELLFD